MHNPMGLFGAIILIFSVGCAPLVDNLEVTSVSLEEEEPRVIGISDGSKRTSNGSKRIRILVIHGMTSKLCPGYSEKIIFAIAESLSLKSPPIQKNNNSLVCDKCKTCTYPPDIITTRYEARNSSEPVLLVDEIYYAGALESIQEKLAADDRAIVGSPAFLNRWFKHELMISAFGDAIAYHVGESCENRFRCQVRNEVRKAVKGIEIEINNEKAKGSSLSDLYIISHSLGSNIVLDVVRGLNDNTIMENLRGVYLLANQHALIDLGSIDLRSKKTTAKALLNNLNNNQIHFAAFSGRDDFLSYALTKNSCPKEASCVNAVLSMGAVIIPFILTNPFAHSEYWTNDTVINCIARGCPN